MKRFTSYAILTAILMAGNFTLSSDLSAKNIVKGHEHDYLKNSMENSGLFLSNSRERSLLTGNGLQRSNLPLKAAPIENVEGREVLYNKYCVGTYGFYEEAFYYEGEFGTKVIWDDDNNKAYFYNILSLANYPSYVEGTIEENSINVSLPQTVYYNYDYGYGVNLVAMKIHDYVDEFGRDAVEYLPDSSISQFSYTINEDGSLSLVIPGEQFDGEELPDYCIGYIYTDNQEWLGYSDFMEQFVPFEGTITKVPDSVELREYTFVYGDYGIKVEVGFDEDTLYIRGLNPNFPDGTISATIEGDRAYISQNEVMGIYDNCFMYTKCVYDNPDYDYTDDYSPEFIFAPEDAKFVLVISDDGDTLTSDSGDMYLCLNGAYDRLYYLAAYREIRLHYQSSYAGTPLNPYGPYWYEEFATGGIGTFFFSIPDQSTEQLLLDVDCLYYRIYVDGKVMTFETEKNTAGGRPSYFYPGFTTPTTLVPYSFMNWQDIYLYADTPRRMVGIYDPDISYIGVQAVYVYEGVTTESEILNYDIESGETTFITSYPSTGIGSLKGENALKGVYNLQGVKLFDNATQNELNTLPKGIYIINGRKVKI